MKKSTGKFSRNEKSIKETKEKEIVGHFDLFE